MPIDFQRIHRECIYQFLIYIILSIAPAVHSKALLRPTGNMDLPSVICFELPAIIHESFSILPGLLSCSQSYRMCLQCRHPDFFCMGVFHKESSIKCSYHFHTKRKSFFCKGLVNLHFIRCDNAIPFTPFTDF